MFIVENGLITSDKTLDIGEIRKIDFIFKFTDTAFDDDDKFELDLGGNKFSLYGFTDSGCLRFTRCDLEEIITKAESNFSVSVLLNGTAILSDELTITAVVQGGGDIVLPDVTVTADAMLKDITAINTDGDVVTGNIENAVITTDETNGLTINVSKGYLANAETKSFSASTITTDQTDGLTINVSKGYLAQNESENFPASTITETSTEVTVSRGFLNEDKTFSVGGSSDVQGFVFDKSPLNKATTVQIIPETLTADWTDFSYMFDDCSALTTVLSLDVSNGTNFSYMFNNCRALTQIPALDTSNGTNFSYMFNNCSALTTVLSLDTSNGTNFNFMFQYCSALTQIPALDVSNGTNFSYMFNNCSALTQIPALDVSNGTDFSSMFQYCSKLTTIPSLDTSNGTSFSGMFYYCSALTSIPSLDTSNGDFFNYMFYYCSALTSIPSLDTSNGTNFNNMFYDCRALTQIPALDTSNGTNFSSMFQYCSALTDFGGLLNVKKSYSLSNSNNLTHESLLNVLNGLYDLTGGTAQTLTLGSTNLAKLTDAEKAIATNKNWTLA